MPGLNLTRQLKHLTIVAVVDISGSTAGSILRTEAQVIRDISDFVESKLLESSLCQSTLVLMTDGQISPEDIRGCAKKTTELGLQGIPPITIVFGFASSIIDGNIDTSVCLAIYPHSPDSLFLFHDIESGSVYIIKAKGSFNGLLAGDEINECFLSGFKMANDGSNFSRKCSICHLSSVLALFSKSAPRSYRSQQSYH